MLRKKTESSILGLRVLLQSDLKLQRPRFLVNILGRKKRNNYYRVFSRMSCPLLSYLLPEELCLLPCKVIGVSTLRRPKSSSQANVFRPAKVTARDHRRCTGGYLFALVVVAEFHGNFGLIVEGYHRGEQRYLQRAIKYVVHST